ncbi:MAG: glycosyltransferase family 2 protein [Deltaproteobacteria bacterium]|nr:glycosyltransferase family 2 protein [Deltaproteobacteria bacterium]
MIAAVVPCFRVKEKILDVLAGIGPSIERIYVVDDRCPDGTGAHVQESCRDPRVKVLFNPENRGVGGAMVTGYRAAIKDGASIVVKLDGDGQMDPRLIPKFLKPILDGKADYAKGNRFFVLESLKSMPLARLFGNAVLSFVNKLASGYWNVMDPTNGYTAIHVSALKLLPLDKIDARYFFESDMLFRLNTIRAVVEDVPMDAVYAGERSSLRIARVAALFPGKYFARFMKRVFYNYFLRDFNPGSIQLVTGLSMIVAGAWFGIEQWHSGAVAGSPATSGTVMLASLPVLLGFQLLLSALNFDIQNVPNKPIYPQFE